MGGLYVFAGAMHFIVPKAYLRIMPPYIPFHRAAVIVSGVAEIALGIGLLIPSTTRWAAWGLIALLIAVFPANFHMFQNPEKFSRIPRWALLIRLGIQGVLIAWAYWHTLP